MKSKISFKQYQFVVMLFALLAATVVIAYPVQAQEQTPIYLPIVLKGDGGTGTANSNTFNLIVSVYNTPTGGQRAAYEANIQHFADAVYEMSNGAHKIRQVRIYSNRQFSDRADVIWVASCWPNANPSGYGRGGGARIEHCDDFQGTSFINDDAGQREGGYTLGHEWGHYFYGMMDEYRGPSSSPGDLGNPEPTDNPVPNSIMNGQSQAVDGDFSWLNFSTEINNGPGAQNAHRRVFQASAWSTLARPPTGDPVGSDIYSTGGSRLYYADLANFRPADGQTPSIELPAGQTQARNQLNIIWMGSTAGVASQAGSTVTEPGIVRYIVIENSDSMTSNDKLFNVIDAVGELIDEAEIGDVIGIITFDTTVTVVQPLTTINNESTRTTILDKLDAITLGSSGAATGNAARQALNEIKTQSTDINRAVYLISGGPVTAGENLAFGVIPSYVSEDIELYTFGYGVDETTETKLQGAEVTEGEYSFIDDTDPDEAFEELLDALKEADQNVSPIVDINIKTGDGTIVTATPFTVPFEIDSTLGEIEAEVFYQGPITSATVTLFDPSLMPLGVPDCETLGSGADIDTVCTFEISDPITGTWTLGAGTMGPNVEIDYWMGGLAEDGSFTLDAEIESLTGEDVDAGQPVTLYATLANNQYKVITTTITATMFDPMDTPTALTFLDNGVAPDDIAQDGIYTVSFTPTVAGEHDVFITFDNNNGMAHFTEFANQYAVNPQTGFTKANEDPFPVGENFERFAEFEFYVD